MQDKAPQVSYEVNGNEYEKPHYLADGIYPDWATLMKSVRNPNSKKTRRFAKMQEACMKDVEREFGVLQARWTIVRKIPAPSARRAAAHPPSAAASQPRRSAAARRCAFAHPAPASAPKLGQNRSQPPARLTRASWPPPPSMLTLPPPPVATALPMASRVRRGHRRRLWAPLCLAPPPPSVLAQSAPPVCLASPCLASAPQCARP
ncbi:hypothetical protein QYE76_066248 [Lolium multiflorum]|uniref:Uncharacterized protein n=1 Tax=Lolium multiflorum TaxID=4521 RepID=A0AAD8SB73_LOLMU|nr:hypothetical protein QYE76_066248 [Lolium multiflorum]